MVILLFSCDNDNVCGVMCAVFGVQPILLRSTSSCFSWLCLICVPSCLILAPFHFQRRV